MQSSGNTLWRKGTSALSEEQVGSRVERMEAFCLGSVTGLGTTISMEAFQLQLPACKRGWRLSLDMKKALPTFRVGFGN